MHTRNVGPIADEILAAIDGPSQIATFTERDPSFRIEHAHATLAELRKKRMARGERQVGRKIGFTNRGIWDEYKVYAPIWGNMYDTTVSELSASPAIQASRFSEPRIEPEIVFKLVERREGRDRRSRIARLHRMGHARLRDRAIDFSRLEIHRRGLLRRGRLAWRPASGSAAQRRVPRTERDEGRWSISTSTLSCNGKVMDRGRGANVLDSPLSALRHLVDVLDMDPFNPPLRAGEIITTGTLTRAFPVAAGETWSTTIEGIALDGVTLKFI